MEQINSAGIYPKKNINSFPSFMALCYKNYCNIRFIIYSDIYPPSFLCLRLLPCVFIQRVPMLKCCQVIALHTVESRGTQPCTTLCDWGLARQGWAEFDIVIVSDCSSLVTVPI